MRHGLWPDEDHATEAPLVLEQRHGPYEVLVLPRDDGCLAGFIEVGERNYAEGCETTPVAYIEGWWVDEDVRRTGAGRALVRAAEERAIARGHREIASDAVIDNRVSILAHRALGFDEVERQVCFRKDLR